MNRLALAAAAFGALVSTAASATLTSGWELANVRGAGTGVVTTAYVPNGPHQAASLQFSTGSANDKADLVNYWGVVPNRTLGNLTGLSYDFLRAPGSTAAQHLAPALRLAFLTSSGKSGLLIFEPVYNGYGDYAHGQFIHADLMGENFWMRAYGPSRTIENYNTSLTDWRNGAHPGLAHTLGADTLIIGMEVGVGSGWSGSFNGAVDNVAYRFNGEGLTSKNFELAGVGVPEPANWALMIGGFGLAGMAARRRRTLVAA